MDKYLITHDGTEKHTGNFGRWATIVDQESVGNNCCH
jgi:hypothetical protein